ncbi:MAG TPA: glycoside hydrolase family 43 protein [Terracidiphilus sp.]|nr:glycoside hydrolase family 43 protein [Terracidiphilus sp.]
MTRTSLRVFTIASMLALVDVLAIAAQQVPKRQAVQTAQSEEQAQGAWLFAYFKEPGSQGIYLALSRDGYHYTPLNNGQPWVASSQPGELMRDVYLTRGPDNRFHMVWTWNWRGNSLGYASSSDLLTWSGQKEIPIMKDFPQTNNVWAPEIYWDRAQSKWLIIWSSSMKDSNAGHRIWSSLTPDFNTFSRPAMFFDPGYVVIDATIFHGATGPYRLIFKDQTMDPLSFQERVAAGPTLEGPWSNISGPINESWSEGPSAIQIGKRFIVFYDHYRAPRARYEAVATTDWKHWEDVTADTSLPAYCKHGSFVKITNEEAERLLARHDQAQPAAATPLTN